MKVTLGLFNIFMSDFFFLVGIFMSDLGTWDLHPF